LKAIAVDDGSDEATASKETPQLQPHPRATKAASPDVIGEPAKAFAPRAGSKLARVIYLLQRSEGATIPNLTEATRWLPHTSRAALTGLRKGGYAVARERIEDGASVYRVSATAAGLAQFDESEPNDRERKPKANRAA
jgi:hypothetical protein